MDITLNWSWLKYDIDQETQKAAKCLITNDPSGEVTMEAQTADDQFDLDYCKRKVTEACTKLQDTLHQFFSAITVKGNELLEVPMTVENIIIGNFIEYNDKNNNKKYEISAINNTNPSQFYAGTSMSLEGLGIVTLSGKQLDGARILSYNIPLVADDTLLHQATSWTITLDNFGNRRNVNSTLLATELHQYVVLYVLQEWTKLTHPTLEQNYVTRLVAEELRIKNYVFRKEPPSRP